MHPRTRLVVLAACLTVAGTSATLPAQASPHGGHHPCHAQLIAFTASAGGHDQIFTVASDGTGLRRITHDQFNYHNPDWSPDGRHLVFDADDGPNAWLVTSRPDGSHLTRLPS